MMEFICDMAAPALVLCLYVVLGLLAAATAGVALAIGLAACWATLYGLGLAPAMSQLQ